MKSGITFLKLFVQKCTSLTTFKYVIENGNKDMILTHGNSLIHYVFSYSPGKIIKYIIDQGYDIEKENEKKDRPIHMLLYYNPYIKNDFDTFKYIIDKIKDYELPDSNGDTLINLATKKLPGSEVLYLINKGVDLTKKGSDGSLPIRNIISKGWNHNDLKQILDNIEDLDDEKYDDENGRKISHQIFSINNTSIFI